MGRDRHRGGGRDGSGQKWDRHEFKMKAPCLCTVLSIPCIHVQCLQRVRREQDAYHGTLYQAGTISKGDGQALRACGRNVQISIDPWFSPHRWVCTYFHSHSHQYVVSIPHSPLSISRAPDLKDKSPPVCCQYTTQSTLNKSCTRSRGQNVWLTLYCIHIQHTVRISKVHD